MWEHNFFHALKLFKHKGLQEKMMAVKFFALFGSWASPSAENHVCWWLSWLYSLKYIFLWRRLNWQTCFPQDYTQSILIHFVNNGMAASCLKVQQMASVNVMSRSSRKLPPNFLCKSDPSAICRISSEIRSTKRMLKNTSSTGEELKRFSFRFLITFCIFSGVSLNVSDQADILI